MSYRLEQSQRVPRPRSEVFAFFANAANLERLTPGWLHFRITTPGPIVMRAGARIDYQLRLFGVPLRWQGLIESFEAGRSFTDVQVKGPYRSWHHVHEFTDVPGGTEMRDVVDYELPFGSFGALAHALFMRRFLESIFAFRRRALLDIFG